MRTPILGASLLVFLLSTPFSGVRVEAQGVDPSLFLAAATTATPTPTATPAPSEATITGQGVAGDIDSKQRNPVLSLSTVIGTENVKILADAYNQDTDYDKYPLKFDFFINRKLFATQIRSPELPGAVGVDVGPDIAVPPFNYTVICTVMHPNREFKTIINGAVETSSSSGSSSSGSSSTTGGATLGCTFDQSSADGNSSSTYTATAVKILQSGSSSASVDFTATETTTSATASVAGNIAISSGTATSSLVVIINGSTQTIATTGTVTTDSSGTITTLDLSSADGLSTLSCS